MLRRKINLVHLRSDRLEFNGYKKSRKNQNVLKGLQKVDWLNSVCKYFFCSFKLF